jgi:methylated-DNA-[protein]-cysteine S-methyltransferase
MQIAALSIDTPIGRYALVANETGLVSAKPAENAPLPAASVPARSAAQRMVERARDALERYFAGSPAELAALPLDPHGSEFQRRVWRALREIPLGATASYGEIARRVGSPGAARAVGDANRRNPMPIVIPCHRVIGGDGRLVGYAGGLERTRRRARASPSGGVVERTRGTASRGARAQAHQRRSLDLTHALARQPEPRADLAERRRLVASGEAEAPVDHLPLAR